MKRDETYVLICIPRKIKINPVSIIIIIIINPESAERVVHALYVRYDLLYSVTKCSGWFRLRCTHDTCP